MPPLPPMECPSRWTDCESQMVYEPDAVVGHLRDVQRRVLRFCPAHAPVVGCDDQKIPRKFPDDRLPALRIAGKTRNEQQRLTIPVYFVVEIHTVDLRVRHFENTLDFHTGVHPYGNGQCHVLLFNYASPPGFFSENICTTLLRERQGTSMAAGTCPPVDFLTVSV